MAFTYMKNVCIDFFYTFYFIMFTDPLTTLFYYNARIEHRTPLVKYSPLSYVSFQNLRIANPVIHPIYFIGFIFSLDLVLCLDSSAAMSFIVFERGGERGRMFSYFLLSILLNESNII